MRTITPATGRNAICIKACRDDYADEKAYWQAVRLGADHKEFWIVGDSPRIVELEKEWGKVTKHFSADAMVLGDNVIVIDTSSLRFN